MSSSTGAKLPPRHVSAGSSSEDSIGPNPSDSASPKGCDTASHVESEGRPGAYLGTLGSHTLVVLTDAESRRLRELLTPAHTDPVSTEAISIFNRGIARGTAKLQQEVKDGLARKKLGEK